MPWTGSHVSAANTGLNRRQLGLGGLMMAGITTMATAVRTAACASVIDPPAWRAEVLACLQSFDHADRPGLSVAIAGGGSELLRWVGGLADLDHGLPVTVDTPFHVASVSKQFTAFSIALLERDGRLDLSDDVRTHLPYVPDLGAPITLGHLIRHTSGLRDQWSLLELAGVDLESHITQRQILNLVMRQQGLNFAPGSQFSYCNTGYTLLAEVVRSVSGQTLRTFAQERIFKPLGMSNTFIYDDASQIIPGRALSYERRNDGGWRYVRLNYETWGATSLHSTASDLTLWGANFSKPKVGDSALIERISSPGRLEDGTPIPYGFGLQIGKRAGHPCVFHGGSDAGFRAAITHFRDDDLTIAVLANTPLEVAHITNQIADIVLNPGPTRLGANLRGALGAPPCPMEALAGAYASRGGELLIIEADATGARLKRSAQAMHQLIFRADGSFDLGQPESLRYRVLRSQDERITELEESLNAGGPPSRYRRVLLAAPSLADLECVSGDYRSPELGTTYRVSVDDGQLVARTILKGDPITFRPAVEGSFMSDDDAMTTFTVSRGPGGQARSITVNSSRMAGVILNREPA